MFSLFEEKVTTCKFHLFNMKKKEKEEEAPLPPANHVQQITFSVVVWNGLTSLSLCPHAWWQMCVGKPANVSGPVSNLRTRVLCVKLMSSYGDQIHYTSP